MHKGLFRQAGMRRQFLSGGWGEVQGEANCPGQRGNWCLNCHVNTA